MITLCYCKPNTTSLILNTKWKISNTKNCMLCQTKYYQSNIKYNSKWKIQILNIICWHCVVTPNHLSQRYASMLVKQSRAGLKQKYWTGLPLSACGTQIFFEYSTSRRYSLRWHSGKTGDVMNGTQIWLTKPIEMEDHDDSKSYRYLDLHIQMYSDDKRSGPTNLKFYWLEMLRLFV